MTIAGDRIDELEALEPDWDSYGGMPPSAKAIATARAMQLTPTCTGGIRLEWHKAGQTVELTIDHHGQLAGISVEGWDNGA